MFFFLTAFYVYCSYYFYFELFLSKGSYIMFLLEETTLNISQVIWAPRGQKILKGSSKRERQSRENSEDATYSLVFSVKVCMIARLVLPGETGRCPYAHLLPSASPRPLPQQLGCVIETFQREICFSSLNFKQNFKCQVSKAKRGY